MPLIDLAGLGHFKDKENEMIAADYSATKTYAVGDYVYYNGVLKRCTTAITTAEAYTAAHWTNAVLAGDVTELKTAFINLNNLRIDYFKRNEVALIDIDGNGTLRSGFDCGTLPKGVYTIDFTIDSTLTPAQMFVVKVVNGTYTSTSGITTSPYVFTLEDDTHVLLRCNKTTAIWPFTKFSLYNFNSIYAPELKTSIGTITGNNEIIFTHGAYIKTDGSTVDITSPVTNVGYRYAVVPCKEDDYFEANVDGAGAARAWAFISANGTIISVSGNNVVTRATLRAPQDSAYFILNCKESASYIPSYINQYVKNTGNIAKQNVDALTTADNYKTAKIDFEIGSGMIASGGTLNFNHEAKNRIAPPAGLFIYAPKGSKFYINDTTSTAQLYVIKKTFDGMISATRWATEYVCDENAYYIPVLRYSDDSQITDVNALASKLTISLLPYSTNSIQRSWKNVWFFDVSHRGYMAEAPESTVASFCRAKAVGYNAIEIDLRITSDGEFVVHHNAEMPSNSSYLIAEHTLAELRANANMGTYNGITQQILTFEDLIKLAKNLDFNVFVELKAEFTTAQIASIIATAKNYDMKNRVYWMASYKSANFDYVGNFRTVDSDCNILVYDTTTASNIQPFIVEGKNITFCYARVTYITATVVQNMANIGVDTIGWCVTFDWLLPDYTEEQVIQKIYDTLDCGVRGMCLDKWTIAELTRMRYSDYF